MFAPLRSARVLGMTLCAAGILMVTMGVRQSTGLFVSPISAGTGLGIAGISFALAVAQFMWGAAQPVAGALAERIGAAKVLAGGLGLLALACALAPLMPTQWGLVLTLGLLSAIGSGAGSFSVLIGAVTRQAPPAVRGKVSGVVNAGGSLGQFIFAPLVQKLIQTVGWMGGMWALAAVALAALPLVGKAAAKPAEDKAAPNPAAVPAAASATEHVSPTEGGLRQAIAHAMRDRSYLLLHAGFFTCGFHIAFLVTHLPIEVGLCGLPTSVASASLAIIGLSNIFGSLIIGHLVGLHRSKTLLALMYGSRAALVLWYLAMPREPWVFYAFAVGLGFTWLATVPPTAAIVGKLFGVRHLGTLFGLTLLSHQTGGFLGAWLGGLAITRFGDYGWMWWADAALAATAAVLNLPIKEAPVARSAAAA